MNEIAKHKASVEDADTQSKVRKRPFLPSSYPFLLPHVLFLLERAKHESTESSGYCPHKLLPAEIRQCFPVAPACTCLTLMGCIWLKLVTMLSLQVHQLYETIQRWSPIATSLPELVQRLVTIKQLHEQGGRPATRGVKRNGK